MSLLAWLLFGLIAGAVAQLLVPGPDPGGGGFFGLLVTIIIGIVGAMVGGFIGAALGWGSATSFDLRSMLIAILGAVVFLIVLRALRGGSRSMV